MAFSIPTFNLRCHVYNGNALLTVPTGSPRITNLQCNLARGTRFAYLAPGGAYYISNGAMVMMLLVPSGSDLRAKDQSVSGESDIILINGYGDRWYGVAGVDDAGLGFPNEYRCAWIFPLPNSWTPPYPGS